MAVWQFDFYILPEANAFAFDESKPWGDEKNEKLLNWQKHNINNETVKLIARFLPVHQSWSKDIRQYGKLDETCIEIESIDEFSVSIRIRIDARNITRELLYEIVCFIQANNAYIVYDNKCYPPNEDILLRLLKDSNACKFCKDPEGFLTSLKPDNH